MSSNTSFRDLLRKFRQEEASSSSFMSGFSMFSPPSPSPQADSLANETKKKKKSLPKKTLPSLLILLHFGGSVAPKTGTLPQASPLPLPHVDLTTIKSNMTLHIGSLAKTKTTPHSTAHPPTKILTKLPSLQPHLCVPTRMENISSRQRMRMRSLLAKEKNTLLLWAGGRFTDPAGGSFPTVPKHISRNHTSTIALQPICRQFRKKAKKMRSIRLDR